MSQLNHGKNLSSSLNVRRSEATLAHEIHDNAAAKVSAADPLGLLCKAGKYVATAQPVITKAQQMRIVRRLE
jgi:hypothetical protein